MTDVTKLSDEELLNRTRVMATDEGWWHGGQEIEAQELLGELAFRLKAVLGRERTATKWHDAHCDMECCKWDEERLAAREKS